MACKLDNETELIECPYDETHLIMRQRFQVHLVRCRRNHEDSTKVTCPFNVTHLVNQKELQWHTSTCDDRLTFETFKQREAIAGEVREPRKPVAIECEENWDDDPPCPTYNPKAHALQAKVLRTFQGGTPRERKEFREAERLRFKKLELEEEERKAVCCEQIETRDD